MRKLLLSLLLGLCLCGPLRADYGLSNTARLTIKSTPIAAAEVQKTGDPAKPTAQAGVKPPSKPALPTTAKPQATAPHRPQVKAAPTHKAPAAKPALRHAARPRPVKPAAQQTGPFAGYPYAVHLSSWRDQAQAVQELNRIGGRVPQAFLTKIDLGPRGVWYRIDCGLCVSPAVAESRRQRILRSGLIDSGSFVGAPMPLTVELGQAENLTAAHARQAELREQKVYTYLIGQGSGRYRIVCGAYPDTASASALLNDLATLKIEARLVRR